MEKNPLLVGGKETKYSLLGEERNRTKEGG